MVVLYCLFLQILSFQLDVLCHRVLSCLAESKPGKEYEDRAYNSSLLLKKLACEHPMLLLRYILTIMEREQLSFAVYLF